MTYTRHALYGLRRAPLTPSPVLIHKIADCGLLRYLSRYAWRPAEPCKTGATRNDPTAAAATDIAPVPHAVNPSSCAIRPSVRGTRQRLAAPPTLYIFNAASLAKKDTVENLTTELIGYGVDIAIITEAHLNKKRQQLCSH